MKKVLIALALVSVAAAPALADYGKAPTTPRHNATVSKAERHAERMRGAPDLRQANDPLLVAMRLQSDYDPNGCL